MNQRRYFPTLFARVAVCVLEATTVAFEAKPEASPLAGAVVDVRTSVSSDTCELWILCRGVRPAGSVHAAVDYVHRVLAGERVLFILVGSRPRNAAA